MDYGIGSLLLKPPVCRVYTLQFVTVEIGTLNTPVFYECPSIR